MATLPLVRARMYYFSTYKKKTKKKPNEEQGGVWVGEVMGHAHQVHMQLTNKKTCFLFFDVEVSL